MILLADSQEYVIPLIGAPDQVLLSLFNKPA